MTRIRMAAAVTAAALVLAACGSSSAAQSVPTSGASANPSQAITQSVTPELTPIADMATADASEEHISYAPQVPKPVDRTDQRIFNIHLESIEGVCPLDPANGVETEMWGFRVNGDDKVTCGTPAPVIRGRVGDVIRLTLTNNAANKNPHNIDFHAVTGQGGGAADLTVAPGESATIESRLLYPGAFMYHCAFGDVPMHIAHGMYGMFIVDPETPLPQVDHEWAVMQSEWYVSEPDANGLAAYDAQALTDENPRYVTFNGRTDALIDDNALHMQVGERSRIYMVNEGLALNSNWHPIGSQWDVVYPEAATAKGNVPIRGSQSTLVTTGGGTITELVGYVPSTVLLVDHALARTFYKGALGQVVIEGDADPEIFTTGDAPAAGESSGVAKPSSDQGGSTSGGTSAEPVATDSVTIMKNAFDPTAKVDPFDPPVIKVAAGTTVTWTNNDAVFHTVTAGTSNGTVGKPDGTFDSGNVDPGETWSYTFDEPGEYPYFCTPHPWMQGKVIVE